MSVSKRFAGRKLDAAISFPLFLNSRFCFPYSLKCPSARLWTLAPHRYRRTIAVDARAAKPAITAIPMNMAMVRGDAPSSDEVSSMAATGAGAICGGAAMVGGGVTAITTRTAGAVAVGTAIV